MTTLNIPCCQNVTEIDDFFLQNCWALHDVEISDSFSKVTTIGENFMYGCLILQEIDLSFMTSLTTIGDYFLNESYLLSSLTLPSGITTIKNYFLKNSLYQLKELDLSNLVSVANIGYGFLEYCDALETLSLPIKAGTSVPDLAGWGLGLEDSLKTIHCGNGVKLEAYMNAPVWNSKANLMVI